MSNAPWIRAARMDDSAALATLIARSARALGAVHYSAAQVEGALRGAFGVDSQLIDDGTYVRLESDGQLAACGGWSYRRTLFGGDARAQRDAGLLDPRVDAACIRAFFVAPEFARRGFGRALLAHCEAQARARRFTRFALMATLPGVPLDAACGHVQGPPIDHALDAGLAIAFVPMRRAD
jgi:GNAT superfamily N-acetyltransferase